MIHPEGPDGLVQAFCALRGISAADLTEQQQAWLLNELRKGHHAFAKAALGHVDALELL
ncbi:hypothetical protein GI374_15290 [Paracoccus sp. S-4012]|uniref:hypothetical protein n=1 Tax=Paracoccus sp. S-4012 TaxID=2665648 RepID=UPI0012AFF60F|nr:hypothetical protein [Paracoccus sp. S-4012]MRX51764.1 hypothetical protein [Paracoccus sp. S-4012]